jgi:hypothetical protein
MEIKDFVFSNYKFIAQYISKVLVQEPHKGKSIIISNAVAFVFMLAASLSVVSIL